MKVLQILPIWAQLIISVPIHCPLEQKFNFHNCPLATVLILIRLKFVMSIQLFLLLYTYSFLYLQLEYLFTVLTYWITSLSIYRLIHTFCINSFTNNFLYSQLNHIFLCKQFYLQFPGSQFFVLTVQFTTKNQYIKFNWHIPIPTNWFTISYVHWLINMYK